MEVQGVSTRKVEAITAKLCGREVTNTQVNTATVLLDLELEAWRIRPLRKIEYLILDARYEKVRIDGDGAMLIAVEMTPDGHLTVIGFGCSLCEVEVLWKSFLKSLVSRKMTGAQLLVRDIHAGFRAAHNAVMPSVPWRRCQPHLMQNAMHDDPKMVMRKEVSVDLCAALNSKVANAALEALTRLVREYSDTASSIAAWAEENVAEGLSVVSLPSEHQQRMRTDKMQEKQTEEFKRCTRVAAFFPNDA